MVKCTCVLGTNISLEFPMVASPPDHLGFLLGCVCSETFTAAQLFSSWCGVTTFSLVTIHIT